MYLALFFTFPTWFCVFLSPVQAHLVEARLANLGVQAWLLELANLVELVLLVVLAHLEELVLLEVLDHLEEEQFGV